MASNARWRREFLRLAGTSCRVRKVWAGVLLCGMAICGSLAAATAMAQVQMTLTSSTKSTRQEAIKSIPLDKLDDDFRAKVSFVTNQAGIFRRLPVQVIDCDPDLYQFLVRHPEVIVNIWELMGISKVTMERTGPISYDTSDHAGSRGSIHFCYSDQDTQLIYAEGAYEGPLFPRPLRARCVLLLKSAHVRENNNRDYVTCRMDAFIHIDNLGVDLLAKTFQPLVTKSADYNFTETAAFVSMVSKTAERNSRGMVRLAAKLKATEPEVRQQFAAVASQVGDRASERQAAASDRQAAAAERQPATADGEQAAFRQSSAPTGPQR
jgi:hypothetical protein